MNINTVRMERKINEMKQQINKNLSFYARSLMFFFSVAAIWMLINESQQRKIAVYNEHNIDVKSHSFFFSSTLCFYFVR